MTVWMFAALVLLNIVQLAALLRLGRRLSDAERVNERLSHFADALTLLTDTTEAGLAGLAAGLTSTPARPPARSTTRATSRRIAKAAKSGQALSAIAADEAMSESEIRLHLELGPQSARSRQDAAAC